MVQKTKKKALYVLGLAVTSLFGSFVGAHFSKDAALFIDVNIAHADIPVVNGVEDYSPGCDSGCSGSDSY